MPERLVAHARDWLAGAGTRSAPPPAKASATVMLLRPGAGGTEFDDGPEFADSPEFTDSPEVFVLRRATTMAFAPDMLAFPGGGVDPRDADPSVPWAGPSPQEWARRLHTTVEATRELVIAGAREVFEECGVLLAGPDADSVVADLTAPEWDDERDALLAREQSFAELLIRRDLVLRTDLLALRAHWITPECEPKRYDTRFFVARLPEGQVADDRSSEAALVRWAPPAALIAEQDRGELMMLPPTRVMLEQLSRATDLSAGLTANGEVWPVMPAPVEHSGGLWMRSPIDEAGNGIPPTTEALVTTEPLETTESLETRETLEP